MLFLFRVEGLEQYPRGAAVIVANHPSALDPLFIAAALPERILFIGAREFLTMPVVGWAMRAYGCIPVRRGQVDASAVRDALRALAAGYKVGVFPEGQISPELSAGRRGGALLAARGGVPLLPVAVVGSGQVFPLGARMVRPGRVTVYIGPPLPPPGGDRADQDAATESAMAWITGALARARHFV